MTYSADSGMTALNTVSLSENTTAASGSGGTAVAQEDGFIQNTGMSDQSTVTMSTNSTAVSGSGGTAVAQEDGFVQNTGMSDQSTVTMSTNSTAVSGGGGVSVPDEAGFVANSSMQSSVEKGLGIFATGTFLDADGASLSGTVELTDGGDGVFVERSVSGRFALSSPPPDSIRNGSNASTPRVDFTFQPSAGIATVREGIGSGIDIGTIQYGAVSGTVTNFAGDPVDKAVIESNSGFATSTGPDGGYSASLPGGSSTTISAAGQDRAVSPVQGETITEDFQFGGLKVRVVLPNGLGIPDVPVRPDTAEKDVLQTDDDGEAVFAEVESGISGGVDIGNGRFEMDYAPPAGGSLSEITKRVGFGVRGTCKTENGEAISGADMRIDLEDPLVSEVRIDGSFVIGDEHVSQPTLVAAEDDPRYLKSVAELDVEEGEVVKKEVRLSETTTQGTY